MSPATQIDTSASTLAPESPAYPESPVYIEPAEYTARQPLPKRVQTGIKCPSCKSPKIRFSTSFTSIDGILAVFGMKALRCHSCYHKFHRLFA